MVQKFSYNWIAEYLGKDAPSPAVISDLLTKHAFEVEGIETKGDDTVIELKILPDRGSDCLCHRGIAREIATLTDTTLAIDPLEKAVTLGTIDSIKVDIENTNDCPRFTASIVSGVTVGDSPQWLKARLATIGVRSINNIVDATNYVMFAMGQPLHAYDAHKFPQKDGAWNFVVRKATAGETVSLLAEGGKDEDRIVTLKGTELLIVDGATNTAVGLAGVKGGRYAGVDTTTTDIIIEAAHFDAGLTRRTARGLNIVIDASKRFENEPSRALPPLAQQNIVDLIIAIAGGKCEVCSMCIPKGRFLCR
jgi:phenylalanyl-tRNA synthetase beta chain